MLTLNALRRALALASALALAGCATSREFGGDQSLAIVEGSSLPEPSRADAITGDRPYYIGPFDKLNIGVFGIEELAEREYQVDSSGRLSFPLAGSIEAGGKTLAEVEIELRQRLKASFVRDPQVTVNLKETVTRVVTVDGQVQRPGSYPVVGKMSLVRAVAIAGSTTEFARLEDVVVFREVAGQRYAALYNLGAIRAGAYSDPEIFANDVVVVGDSQARRIFRDVLSAAPLLTTPLIILFRNN